LLSQRSEKLGIPSFQSLTSDHQARVIERGKGGVRGSGDNKNGKSFSMPFGAEQGIVISKRAEKGKALEASWRKQQGGQIGKRKKKIPSRKPDILQEEEGKEGIQKKGSLEIVFSESSKVPEGRGR